MIEVPQVGDKIRLLEMPDDPDPIPIGTTGTVTGVSSWEEDTYQVQVNWDIPRTLNLILPIDKIEIL